MASIDVRPVRSEKDLGRFLDVPHICQGHDPAWVPPLRKMVRDQLDPNKNPWFGHGEAAQWYTERDGASTGRISAQIDQSHLQRHNDSTGFFGFFDCVDDQYVADALFKTALGWLKDRGMQRAVGPFSLNINEESGLLVDGFISPPKIMMGHAQPYYRSLVEGAGFEKVTDMLAFLVQMETALPPQLARLRRSLATNNRYKVRHLDLRRYDQDIRIFVDIFNAAWADNWGFIPLTEADAKHMAREMRPLLIPEMVWFAFYDGEPSAVAVCLPDLNEMIADLDGRLWPTGWAKLAWRVMNRRAWSSHTRVLLTGVLPRFKKTSQAIVLSLLVLEPIRDASLKLNLPVSEMSWVLEDNAPTIHALTNIGGRVYKTYRMYGKTIA